MGNVLAFKESQWIFWRKQNSIDLNDRKIVINGVDIKPFEINSVTLEQSTLPWSFFELQKITISYLINKEEQYITCVAPSNISQDMVNSLNFSIQQSLSVVIDELNDFITEIQKNIDLTFKEKKYIRHSKVKNVVDLCKTPYETSSSSIKFLRGNKFLSASQKSTADSTAKCITQPA